MRRELAEAVEEHDVRTIQRTLGPARTLGISDKELDDRKSFPDPLKSGFWLIMYVPVFLLCLCTFAYLGILGLQTRRR